MEKAEFNIGQFFYTATGKWYCSDIGQKTISAIYMETDSVSPSPHEEAQYVFDEYDFGGCYFEPQPIDSYSNIIESDREIYLNFLNLSKDKILKKKVYTNNYKLHILGMAKSSLDLKGGKSKNLELDFLRILYAINTIPFGEQVISYIAVWDEKIEKRINLW